MGVFPGSASEARSLALSLRPDFDGATYNLLTKCVPAHGGFESLDKNPPPDCGSRTVFCRNCNAYSDALCRLLLNKPIPPHVNRAAYLGSFFSCLLPEDLSGQAPVGDTGGGAAASNRRVEYSAFAGPYDLSILLNLLVFLLYEMYCCRRGHGTRCQDPDVVVVDIDAGRPSGESATRSVAADAKAQQCSPVIPYR
jgi:hypothetical protein